jgi:hypothetical protein
VLPVTPVGALVDIEGWSVAGTSQSYDRQTQNAVYPMTKRHDDGFIGTTWTTDDNSPFPTGTTKNRGIGYSCSTDGGATWSAQENRVGGIPLYWPSYAQWGANGEAILGRSADTYMHQGIQIQDGLVLLTRANKGVGAWTITPIPYPAGASPSAGYTMAWARMTTSGNNHQYIHIMSPMSTPTGQPYQGYTTPTFYYRTQTGGSTWDIQGKLVREMLGEQWDAHSSYTDAVTFADTKGDVVACSFIKLGSHGYVLRSHDNGSTWESIKFFDSPVSYYTPPSQYADTCYVPVQGCIALDNDGKIHVAFAALMAKNSQNDGYITTFTGITASFLSYWNEYMEPINGDTEYVNRKIKPILWDLIEWDEEGLYIKSTTPKLPVIGFYTPIWNDPYFRIYEATPYCYGSGSTFSFPQMIVDRDNTLHLAYLGLIDEYDGNINFKHHPFYTSTNGGAIWTQTKYLINNIELIDQELAYLTLAGIDDSPDQWIYLMAQVDSHAGTYTGTSCQTAPTINRFWHFHINGDYIEPCYPVTNFTVDYTADCKAELTWNDPPTGGNQFKIYRDGNLIATVNSENSYTDTGFDTTKGHTWKVAITCTNGEPYPISVTKPACEPLPPPPCNPATNLKVEISNNCNTATLTWSAAPDMPDAKYNIYRDGVKIASSVPGTQYTNDGDFGGNVEHTWTVKTVCEDGEATGADAKGSCEVEGINELANSVTIYPNPTNGKLTVDNGQWRMEKIEIFDVFGRKLSTINCQLSIQQIDVSTYSTGVYFFKIYDVNNNSVTKRVIVAR